MSRNLRRKATSAVRIKKPAKTTRAPSPTSSDDGYDGLDDISESDDEEPDVEAAEEQAIIDSMARGSDDEADADDESDDADADDEDNEDVSQPGTKSHDDEEFNGFPDEPTNKFFDEQFGSTTRRRVRFNLADEVVDYISPDESDSDGSIFPDLLAEDEMDPHFRQLVQNEDDETSSETFWDLENIPNGHGDIDGAEAQLINTSEEDTTSSDYSTDEGETTDEDIPVGPNHTIQLSNVILSRGDASSDEEEVTMKAPKLGTWWNDGTESFAVTDHSSQKLVVFVAKANQKARRHSYDAPSSTPMTARSSMSDLSQSEMVKATPQHIMLGASWLESANNDFIVSPEAVTGSSTFELNPLNLANVMSQSSTSSADFDQAIAEDVNFDDFVTGDFDEEEEDESAIGMDSSPSRSRRVSEAASHNSLADSVNPFLSHLESTGVGSFRKNQNRHRLITRNNESYESLAFGGSMYEGTLRGVKQGKLAAVTAPITPMRKVKTPAEFSSSPAVEANKRKREMTRESSHSGANGYGRSHKRTRSMV